MAKHRRGEVEGAIYTIPKSHRMLPVRDKQGSLDVPHIENARSRLHQQKTEIPEYLRPKLYKEAGKLLDQATREDLPMAANPELLGAYNPADDDVVDVYQIPADELMAGQMIVGPEGTDRIAVENVEEVEGSVIVKTPGGMGLSFYPEDVIFVVERGFSNNPDDEDPGAFED